MAAQGWVWQHLYCLHNAPRVSPKQPSGVTGTFVTFGARVNSEKCLSRQWGGEKPSPELCDWELCLGALRCGKPEPPFAEGSSDAAPMLLSAAYPWGEAALAQGVSSLSKESWGCAGTAGYCRVLPGFTQFLLCWQRPSPEPVSGCLGGKVSMGVWAPPSSSCVF